MTYCNSLCEAADLGFTIEAMLRWDSSANTGSAELAVFRAAFEQEAPAAA